MNIFEQAYHDSIRDYFKKDSKMHIDEEREYGRMVEANHDDLMDQLKYAEIAKSVIYDHGLGDTDLLQLLMTAGAMWNEKPETAHERMKAVHQLIWLAVDRIAQEQAQRELDAMLERG